MEDEQVPETPVPLAPEDAPPPPTVAEAAAWLALIKPSVVITLLRDPELGLIVGQVFHGFRADAKGYATNTLVKSRLAQAAVKEAKLADKLRALAALQTLVAPVEPAPSPAPPKASASAEVKPDPRHALRAERDQRRKERDEARQGLARAEAERDEATGARIKAEAERDEATRIARKQAERIARLERQVQRRQEVETHLLKVLGQDKVSPPPSAPARAAGPTPAPQDTAESPWLTAVRHLLDKGKWDLSLALAEDVLKSNAEDAAALDVASLALEGKREFRPAASFARRLLALQTAQGAAVGAAETLGRVLRLLPQSSDAEAEARAYLAALSPSDGSAVEAARRLLSRLRSQAPEAHAWLTEYVSTKTPLGPILMPPPGAISPDDPLPLPFGPGQTATARQLAEAVDRGQEALVEMARVLLDGLGRTDPETHARVWTALEQASDDDPTRLLPLRRTPRGPAVVDASNVAWFDQESLVQGKPRLRHLREIRRALRKRGYFPVVLYADANLPYFIDEPLPLRAMRDRRELTFVDAGTVADEVLLRYAKLLGAPLVTNDKMEDWDPDHEVTKLRYTISLSGEAHLLSDL